MHFLPIYCFFWLLHHVSCKITKNPFYRPESKKGTKRTHFIFWFYNKYVGPPNIFPVGWENDIIFKIVTPLNSSQIDPRTLLNCPFAQYKKKSTLCLRLSLSHKGSLASFFLSRDKTEKVEKSPDGKMIKIPPCMNTNLTEGIWLQSLRVWMPI